MTLPIEIIESAKAKDACAEGLAWAESPEATIETVPEEFRNWWVMNIPEHLTPWWDGQIMEQSNGSRYWYIDGKFHREDGPAVEYASGTNIWYIDGKIHREDGPAIERADGTKEWWLNGKFIREEIPNRKATP